MADGTYLVLALGAAALMGVLMVPLALRRRRPVRVVWNDRMPRPRQR
ncbi:MAG: hypothetical protein KIS73_27680 [Enhydrobacter sp.]|nr:hypothetical protein [Enhydrobacter sp.]